MYAQGSDCLGPVRQGGATVTGTVMADQGIPLSGAEVLISWEPESEGAPAGIRVHTDAAGSYLACGLPAGTELELSVSALGRRGQPVSLTPDPGSETLQNLTLSLMGGSTEQPGGVSATAGDAAGEPRAGTGGTVIGRVLDAKKDRPLADATVALGPGENPVTTGEDGTFTFENVEPGTHGFRVEHPEHGSQQASVKVPRGRTVDVLVQLGKRKKSVEPVKATVRLAKLERGGFYERMRRGNGYYITPEMVAERRGGALSQVFRTVPGVRLERVCAGSRCTYWPVSSSAPARMSAGRGRAEMERVCTMAGCRDVPRAPEASEGTEACLPAVFLNGNHYRVAPQQGINEFNTASVAAIEVYRGASEVPGEFTGFNARCGAIAIWTR